MYFMGKENIHWIFKKRRQKWCETYNDQLESMIQQILDDEEESKMKIINKRE